MVATIGFPNTKLQGREAKVTRGEISSLAGLHDDPRSFQVSLPIQPGNSGGPLLDQFGNVVGVVVGKLNPLVTLNAFGALPENVNYAIKSGLLSSFLEGIGDGNLSVPTKRTVSFEDMTSQVLPSVVFIEGK
jgi:S1-C subfamily serine protease